MFVFIELIIAVNFRSLRYSLISSASPQMAAARHRMGKL